MATQIIMNTHTYDNSREELKIPKRNEFVDGSNLYRAPKMFDTNAVLQPDTAATFGATVKYNISTNTGLMSGKTLCLYINLGISSTTGTGVLSYCDGFLLALIKNLKMVLSNGQELKMDANAIQEYYQRICPAKKSLYYTNARIGSTGNDIDPARTQDGALYVPNPFNDTMLLKVDLIKEGNKPYIEIEYHQLSHILKSTVGTDVLSGSIQTAVIHAPYINVGPDSKREILGLDRLDKTLTGQGMMIDYINYNVPSGTEAISLPLPFNGESEYLHFVITENGEAPFTGLTTVSEYDVLVDNHTYPEVKLPLKVAKLNQTQYFGRQFDNGHYTIEFSSFASKDDDINDDTVVYGSLITKRLNNPKLNIKFSPAVVKSSTIHIMSYGRGWFKHIDGKLILEMKN